MEPLWDAKISWRRASRATDDISFCKIDPVHALINTPRSQKEFYTVILDYSKPNADANIADECVYLYYSLDLDTFSSGGLELGICQGPLVCVAGME